MRRINENSAGTLSVQVAIRIVPLRNPVLSVKPPPNDAAACYPCTEIYLVRPFCTALSTISPTFYNQREIWDERVREMQITLQVSIYIYSFALSTTDWVIDDEKNWFVSAKCEKKSIALRFLVDERPMAAPTEQRKALKSLRLWYLNYDKRNYSFIGWY